MKLNRIFGRSWLACLMAASLTTPALAQDLERETARGEKAQAESRAADKAASASARVVSTPEVTFEEILKDPDNIDLNFRYAKSQIAKNNLRSAAATLERILMVDADLPKVRLMYAIVLFRLDTLNEAEREFNELLKLEMPDSLRREIRMYLREIKRRQRDLNFAGRLGLGLEYNSNRNAAPSSGRRLFFGNPLTLTSGAKDPEWSSLVLLNARTDYDPGWSGGHKLFASLGAYRADQFQLNTLDLGAYNLGLGATLNTAFGTLTPTITGGLVRLDGEKLMKSLTASTQWDRKISDRTGIYLNGSYGNLDYENSTKQPFAADRSGHRWNWVLGATRVMTAKTRLGCFLNYADNSANRRFNSFERESFGCSHSWLMGGGFYWLNSATRISDIYDSADSTIAAARREDSTWRLRTAFGSQLGRFHRLLTDAAATVSYEYYDVDSTIENYTHDNHKASVLFTYKWNY